MRLTETDMEQAISDRVAAEVRAEIARQGLTRASVAAKLGWTDQRFSLRMTGRVALSVAELVIIAEVLGVPTVQFVPAPARAA